MRLDDIHGFMFDLDGTLIHRGAGGFEVLPGARDVLESVAASGRPYVVFTNGSHVAPQAIARELRDGGLPVGDDQLLTPICSAISELERRHPGRPVLAFATDAAREHMRAAGVPLVEDPARAEIVFVAHPGPQLSFAELEGAARAVLRGARLLTGSYVAAYAGADGPIISRGAMVTAAIAKASGARPTIVGKPSRAALREIEARLGLPAAQLAVVGDDLTMDIPLGHLGGSRTILVRSGISADLDPARLPARSRPHASIAGVADLLGPLQEVRAA